MKKVLLLSFSLIAVIAHSQKVPVLTLRADEELDLDNSKIITSATGATHEIVTMYDGKYLKYTKTEKGVSVGADIREGEFITTGKENGMSYFRVETTGKKYGPYEGVNPYYDEEKKVLYGYTYVKEGMTYYVDEINNKTLGPYYKGGVWLADDKDFVYSNTVKNAEGKEEVFLYENDKKYGPYDAVVYKKGQSHGTLIIRKENGKFYVNIPKWKDIAFAYSPSATEIKDGWLLEGTETTYKERNLYLPNGKKLELNDKLKHSVNAKGDILKMELLAGGGMDAAYKITMNGKEVGTYAVKKWNRSELGITDLFDQALTKVNINGNWSLAIKQENYIYSSSKGLIGPFTENEMRYVFLIKDGYGIIKADSTLEINGQKMMEKVTWFDGKNYPDEWYAFQKRGDYVYPFKNGEEVSPADVPEKLRYLCTTEKDVIMVQRKDEFYLRVKINDKLLGPVGQYDAYVVSSDGNHYATERGEDGYVVIDGKPIAQGFSVVYNPEMKAFHWYVQDGQKLSLYTYKLK